MKTDLFHNDEAQDLARRLCALTGENAATAVALALREHARRALGGFVTQAGGNRADVLARAIRLNAGPGIPVNHCWGDADASRVG